MRSVVERVLRDFKEHLKPYLKKPYERLRGILHIVVPVKGPHYCPTIDNPRLELIDSDAEVSRAIDAMVRERGAQGLTLCDAGGGGGMHKAVADGVRYVILDISPGVEGSDAIEVIEADICDCPQVADESFDIVYSNNVFEHLKEPWKAAAELGRLLKPGGLVAVHTAFAWRYHPVPEDYWRYSHSALAFLFEEIAGLETLKCGYDLSSRRMNVLGGNVPKGEDQVPKDLFGGFREQWRVTYIGRKPE